MASSSRPQFIEALLFIGFCTRCSQNPANGSWFQAQHIVFDTHYDIGVEIWLFPVRVPQNDNWLPTVLYRNCDGAPIQAAAMDSLCGFRAAAAVGFSRLSLSQHFASDVFLGAALGSITRFGVLQY